MKNNIITISISVVLSVIFSSLFIGNGGRLGSTIITTNTSDTIETFRTNVNSSLTSLQAFASSTAFVGILASSSPTGSLTVEQGTEANSFWVANTGSSTPSFMVSGVNANGRVGIATSTPFTMLGIGRGGATSTISGGYFCAYFQDETGRGMWIKLATSGSSVFSTSTTACN